MGSDPKQARNQKRHLVVLSAALQAIPIYWRQLRARTGFQLFVSSFLLIALMSVLSSRFELVPPLGGFLDPYHGVWDRYVSPFERPLLEFGKNSKQGDHAEVRTFSVEGLKGTVTIKTDRDQIKHVFTENDEDLYFTQGFVVASDRLWQMEFLSRLAAGRVAEILGRRALQTDLYFIKMGLPDAAKQSLEGMLQDPQTDLALRSYAAGVNAYIKTLDRKRLPLEYKLLGHEPEEWTPLKTALLMKFMAWNLSSQNRELALTRSRARLTLAEFNDLFPLNLKTPEPIVPESASWNFQSRAPEPPLEHYEAHLEKQSLAGPKAHSSNGSNNWAVTGKKSTTQLPILANDVHLGLSLPALWYEIQLSSPTQNVYGVTLPGAPGVILGFNRRLAWAVTNAGLDALDWYELRYRDHKKNEYLHGNGWRPVISREVSVRIRGEVEPLTILLKQTHIGPIVYDSEETPLGPHTPKGLAMRWVALGASQELKTFLRLNRAASTEECREAIEPFQTPAQNFLCVDQRNNTGLWHMGRAPIRWPGQGRLISDGSDPTYDWRGWIPPEEMPKLKNPARGFLSSANQAPAGADYPHYLGWPFEEPFRAMRINEILRKKAKFSPEDLMAMQSDTQSVLPGLVLPSLLKALEPSRASLDQRASQALATLTQWDHRFEENSVGAALFDAWLKAVEEKIWKPHFPDVGAEMTPTLLRTVQLIEAEPESKWFDNPDTPAQETLRDLAHAAFLEALQTVSDRTGKPKPEDWIWSRYQKSHFAHVGHLPGLGEENVSVRGYQHSIFATQDDHGPVWKVVVAMGTSKPRAWGIYPGGQSGDPASPYYQTFLETWRKGSLREIHFLTQASEALPNEKGQWQLRPPAKPAGPQGKQ